MTVRLLIILLAIALIIIPAAALPTPDEWRGTAVNQFSTLTRDEVDAFISPLITYNLSKGVIVVLVDRNGYTWYSYGVADILTGERPDNTTLFDIGSISKVMTGLLMADAEARGEFNISAPVNTWLPGDYAPPTYEGLQITGVDLVTHRSGLPGVPDRFTEVDPASSEADQIEESMQHYQTMSADDTYLWLTNTSLMAPPGYQYLYSNLGAAIAGDIVARATKIPYPRLLAERILTPLGMTSSGATWTQDDLTRRAAGYRSYEYPADEANLILFNEFWTATGGVHASGDDMAVYLAAQMGLLDTPLSSSIAHTHISRAVITAGPPRMEQGVFWDILYNRDGTTIISKAGETNAHQAAIAFNKAEQVGVVILSNTASIGGTHVQEQAVALLEKMHVRMMYPKQ
ncbi:MAG TPA: serine hydrolase domain-containing protein [Methanospirillum sp.]|nr:serine hydrolase domain-containing protein [Methanospirillum sp.]